MRINFFGGPGSGKSTTTARVFAELKERMFSVEIVLEYVKAWAHAKRAVNPLDQVYLFGKQHQYEYRFIAAGVKNIVTDSPCWLSVFYAKHFGLNGLVEPLSALCRVYDEAHPCTNIFLHRGEKPYVQEGRYQTYNEAQELDVDMLAMLNQHYGNVLEFDYRDKQGVLDAVLQRLDAGSLDAARLACESAKQRGGNQVVVSPN